MEIVIRTSKGIFNASEGWTGRFGDIVDELREFFNKKRLDDIAEIIKRGVLRDLDQQKKPSGGGLRSLRPLTLKYKKTNKKLVETGQLRSEIDYQRRGSVRIIGVFGDRTEIAGYLQFGTDRMKAFYWFGVSKETSEEIKEYVEDEWIKILKKVA